MTSTVPDFSVVIPTFNRLATLLQVLDGLGQQKNAPAFEVVVIDDGSSDTTAATISAAMRDGRFPYPIRFESQSNSGPGNARNRGVALSAGRRILFIGDDTVPEQDFLAEHHRIHQQPEQASNVACLGYTGWPLDERVTPFMDYINDYGLQFGYRLIEDGADVPFNFFYTSNISLSRELLVAQPFDTSFPAAAWEDIELAYRLKAAGLRIVYNAKAVTRHYHPITVDSFAKRQYKVGKSGAVFYSKHPELGHFLGVFELTERPPATSAAMFRLRLLARIGERFKPLARPAIFEKLMREHYLRGLREGLGPAGPA
ncbi:MAG TPA: glycosyltransferase family 2 protein [Thermoanaerobaculia bacterium]|nr:glycosyltransferase family 2 protein [Thermoanaerobaculia bacterium]